MIITLSSYERDGLVFVKIRNDRHYQFSLEECIKEETWPSVTAEIYSLMETYEYSFGYSTHGDFGYSTHGDIVKKSLIFFNGDELVYTVNIEIPPDEQGFILAGYLKDTILDSIISGRINQEVSHG